MFVATAWRPNNAYTPVSQAVAIGSSAAVPLNRTGAGTPASPINVYNAFRIVNQGADTIAILFGQANVGAATLAGGIMMLPNSVEVIDLPPEITHFTVIGVAGGTSTVRFYEGNGL